MRAGEITKVQLRGIFNKLDKDNKDKMMLKIAKISHNQPLVVFNELRRNRLEI
jgi:hypothetical protein